MYKNLDKEKIARKLEVHLPIPIDKINPIEMSHRAFPLKDFNIPIINLNEIDKALRINHINHLINLLDVENSARYKPSSDLTYCNIYAHDLAYCLGAFIPRVWWDEESVSKILNGEKVSIEYASTVFELNCNSLSIWFEKFGQYFNWIKVENAVELSKLTNKGSIGVIIAKRDDLTKPGHISLVVPPQLQDQSKIDNLVLQSQAGAVNRKFFNDLWWLDRKFRSVDFWIWDLE